MLRTITVACTLALLVLTVLAGCRQGPDEKGTYTPARSQRSGEVTAVAPGTPPQPPPEGVAAEGTEGGTEEPATTEGGTEEGSTGEAATDEGAANGEGVAEEGTEGDEDAPPDEPKDEPKEEEVQPEPQEEDVEIVTATQLYARADRAQKAMFETSKGNFIIAIYPEIAPASAPHFIRLISEGFYDGIRIHRYEPGFVVQMGQVFGPDGTPLYRNDPKKAELAKITIPDEPCRSENTAMTVSFAKPDAPNSASCQFFINLGDNRRLDKLNYGFTVMGLVIHGQDVVRNLRVGDVIGRAYMVRTDTELGS